MNRICRAMLFVGRSLIVLTMLLVGCNENTGPEDPLPQEQSDSIRSVTQYPVPAPEGWHYFKLHPELEEVELLDLFEPEKRDLAVTLSEVEVRNFELKQASLEKAVSGLNSRFPSFRFQYIEPDCGGSQSITLNFKNGSLLNLVDQVARLAGVDYSLSTQKVGQLNVWFTDCYYTKDLVVQSNLRKLQLNASFGKRLRILGFDGTSCDCTAFLIDLGIPFPLDRGGIRGKATFFFETNTLVYTNMPFFYDDVEQALRAKRFLARDN